MFVGSYLTEFLWGLCSTGLRSCDTPINCSGLHMDGSLLSDGSGDVGQEAKAKRLGGSLLGQSLVIPVVEQRYLLLLGLWTICFRSCRFHLPHLLGMWVCAAHFTNFWELEVIWQTNLELRVSCWTVSSLIKWRPWVTWQIKQIWGFILFCLRMGWCPSRLSLLLFFSGSSLSHVELVLSALLYLSHKLSPIYL